jgi:uncharacterized protein (TIGR00730 family)
MTGWTKSSAGLPRVVSDLATTMPLKSVCVFCGSNPGIDPIYVQAARGLGNAIASRGMTLVYGGGRVGLMGAIAEAVLGVGGKVIGVIPEGLKRRELAFEAATELYVVDTMHERKQQMADLSDGFIAMPGGFGTFEEFCEVITWAQLGVHTKPCGLLNVKGYYDHLLALFDHAVAEELLQKRNRSIVLTESEPQALLDAMARYKAPAVDKWLTSEKT